MLLTTIVPYLHHRYLDTKWCDNYFETVELFEILSSQ